MENYNFCNNWILFYREDINIKNTQFFSKFKNIWSCYAVKPCIPYDCYTIQFYDYFKNTQKEVIME